MGRYVSGGGGAVGSGLPRRETVIVTVSNPALAVPLWAQGGNGIVYVTGTGAGGSGGVYAGSGGATNAGQGGGSGARAERYLMRIAAGVETVAVIVGAGGNRRGSTGNADGQVGGDSEIVVGSRSLKLEGGRAGIGAPADFKRLALPLVDGQESASHPATMNSLQLMRNGTGIPYTDEHLGLGLYLGGRGAQGSGQPYGAGAMSPFGAGGPGRFAITGVTNGTDATGYGAGGSGGGGSPGTGTTVYSGAGAPGYFELEFVEGT